MVDMTREQLYKSIEVVKGNHYCRICDDDADFVIVNPNIYGEDGEHSLCKACAKMLKSKIDIGLKM